MNETVAASRIGSREAITQIAGGAALRRVRLMLAGAAMMAGPALLAVAELISPVDTSGDSSEERVGHILEHPTRFNITELCMLTGMMLLIPAVLTLRNEAPGRGEGWAWTGTVFAVAGLVLFCVNIGAMGVGPSAWPAVPEAERSGVVAVSQAMDDFNGVLPVTIPGVFAPVIGFVLLSIGLWRSGLPRWTLVLIPLGWLVFLFGPSQAARAAGNLIMLAGFTGVAAYLLRGTLERAERISGGAQPPH